MISGFFSTSLRTRSPSIRLGARRCGVRCEDPVCRFAADTLNAQPTLTPKRAASSRNVPLPAAWASNNFFRRSSLYARAIYKESARKKLLQRIKLYTSQRTALEHRDAVFHQLLFHHHLPRFQ